MKKHTFTWLIVGLLFTVTLVIGYRWASADAYHDQVSEISGAVPRAASTALPTSRPGTADASPTPEGRVLPAVGSNAFLVIGASVLVLIIIGGVLSGRAREKH